MNVAIRVFLHSARGEKFKCPLDNTVCSRGKEVIVEVYSLTILLNKFGQCRIVRHCLLQTFPDRDFERRVKNLKVKCNHSGKGCQWMGELTTLQVFTH